jgi:hypothetical protein
LTWAFFAKKSLAPAISAVTPPIQPAKLMTAAPVAMVEAPKLSPAQPKDAPPVQVTEETRAANDALRARRLQIAQQMLDQFLDPNNPMFARQIAAAPDDDALAQVEQQHQDMIAQAQQRVANLANPPEDIGVIDLALASSGPVTGRMGQTYTLKSGETFTINIMNQASRGTEIMLSETMASGHGTSNQRVTPTPGQPMVMFLNDGNSVQFAPTGTVNPPQPVDNSPPLPGAPPPATAILIDDGTLAPTRSQPPGAPMGGNPL